ncbi:MAG: undecaprenyldiphospho-muramoylpentapeptide beta-N-acetylglucosaminyltransferase [Deltaproteobacteria bacterium]|jgi:UDP-N-acetylglucosamine--N-acetylmuramyl-(pentapeptide) pyrophosphoryl-undecaprenol N-acetylglucosamine transferase|nr:undecaprenyldiphospho-muramoylpentapeptide beta-N-acetylglucosaminyltransferase [Deltaproteobacteria bacterium]
MRKVVLTTGGTGGHIFPALAVAEELRRRFPAIELLFVGGEYGPESKLAAQAGLAYLGLPVRGFLGRGVKAAGAAFSLLKSIGIARKKLKAFGPDLVIGFGGYAAAASLAAARLLALPCMIHEQNSLPGLANRLAGRFAARVCISLPDAAAWFKAEKVMLTGNPVRASISRACSAKQAPARPVGPISGQVSVQPAGTRRLLVLGGSQGARAVNSAVLEDLPALMRDGVSLRLQTGAADYERVAAEIKKYDPDMPACLPEVSPFIYDMAEAYGWADLVLCRAGATTVAELAVAGLPAVLVPFPQATHNHQLHNARQVESLGAALVLEQKDLTPGLAAATIAGLFDDPARLEAMARAALALARPDAAARVVDEAARLIEKKP